MKNLYWLLVLLTLSCHVWANPLGAQPTLVMTVYFDRAPAPADVRAMVNEADRQLRLNSSGMTWLEPLYAESFRPSQPAEAYRGAEGMRRLRQEALAQLPATPQLRRYRRQVLVVPAEFEAQASLGTVGYELVKCSQDEFYASTALVRYVTSPADCGLKLLHELGHNFGFQHGEGCDAAMDAHRAGALYSAADRAAVGWPVLAPATAGR